MNRLNKAKVFSGFTTVETRTVPYIVVVKCGKESEVKRPGNRGKRDSQLIMMKFLNKIHFQRDLVPLEYEIYRHIKEVIGIDPKLYEYCLMVDADTEVLEDSLIRLMAVFCHDSLIMGLCGETRIGNEQDSFVTMIQVYEYYISHHLAKAFESFFGSVTCLPGCFCMYRLRTHGRKPRPLLIDDRVIHDYEENNVDTLHKKNLLSLGEDRYLTTLMLKNFPEFRNKFTPDAACQTIVPDKFSVLLSQRRRWINSTIHNLWELLLVPDLCGCLCFSMRFIVFLDLFATLTMPGSVAYLGYLIYEGISSNSVETIVESLYLFAAIYGCQAVIFLLRRKFDMIGWMVIYILSLPVYGFFLPAYAYWNFDDFSWGNTRLVIGENQGGHTADDAEEFNEKDVKLINWPGPKAVGKEKTVKGSEFDALDVKKSKKILPEVDLGENMNTSLEEQSSNTEATSESYQLPYMARQIYIPHGRKSTHLPNVKPPFDPSEIHEPAQGTFLMTSNIHFVPQSANLSSPLNKNFSSMPESPEGMPDFLAHVIYEEIYAVVSSSDLSILTKKKVRESVENEIIQEWKRLKARPLEVSRASREWQTIVQEIKDESQLFLSKKATKEWISRCVDQTLVQIYENKI